MAGLFETRTLGPLLQLTTTTPASVMEDLKPVVKLLDTESASSDTENMADNLWSVGQETLNGSWPGSVVRNSLAFFYTF